MRRFVRSLGAIGLVVALTAGCSKRSSSTTVDPATSTPVFAPATAAGGGADTPSAGRTPTADPAVDESVNQMLEAMGVESPDAALTCLHSAVPDLAKAMGSANSPPELLRGLLTCVPDQLAAATGRDFVARHSNLTGEQGRCIAAAYYAVLKRKGPAEFAAFAGAASPPEAVKEEILTEASSCGLDRAALVAVLDN